MSNPSNLAAVIYEAESPTGFGEDVTTFGTLRLPVIESVDVSTLKHEKHDAQRVNQYRQEGTQWILGAQAGSTFKTKFWLTGHGSPTSGATTVTAIETLLGIVIGNVIATASAGTTFSGGTATAPTTTASGTLAAGGLFRAGTLGDGRGNGQFYPVGTHVATALTPLVALDGAPLNGDVLHSAVILYPNESPTASAVTSIRMLVQTANLRYELHGCVPTGFVITGGNTGERLAIEITWAVAWWRHSTVAFPSAVATDSSLPSVNAAGSFVVGDVGDATRNKRSIRNFTIEWTLGMELLVGPGGVNPYQTVIGARRTTDTVKLTWTEDADATTLTPALHAMAVGTTFKHVCYTLSTTAGSAVGFYFPRVCITSVPTQKADGNMNRLPIEAMAYTGPTSTNDLTLSCARIARA